MFTSSHKSFEHKIKTMETEKKFEVNKLPTFLALLFVFLAWLLNEIVLSWVHDHYPSTLGPLPDTFFRIFPEIRWVMVIAEYIMLTLTVSGFAVMFLHQHRWIVLRRVLFCAGICYTIRATCITLLQVPVPSKSTYCAPQQNSSVELMTKRVLNMFWSAGIEQLRPRELCGDLIVSGHTITIFTSLMAFKQYAPRKFAVLGYIYHALAFVAITCILLARKHYSIDVFLAYMLTTRTFWTYHSLAMSYHDGNLHRNPMSKALWSYIIPYMERDAPPSHLFLNVLQWPSSCPQKIRRKLDV